MGVLFGLCWLPDPADCIPYFGKDKHLSDKIKSLNYSFIVFFYSYTFDGLHQIRLFIH
jgi:hypothetical protein